MAPTLASKESNKLEKPPIKFSNLLVGSGLNMFEVSTLGQPLEVMKTTMAANRGDGMAGAVARIWSRGGVFGCELDIPSSLFMMRRSCAQKIHTME